MRCTTGPLFIDGLDDQWQEGVSLEWEGQAGEVSLDDLRSFDDEAELLAAYDATTQPAGQHQHDTRRATTTNLLVQRIPDAILRLRNPVADESLKKRPQTTTFPPLASPAPITQLHQYVE